MKELLRLSQIEEGNQTMKPRLNKKEVDALADQLLASTPDEEIPYAKEEINDLLSADYSKDQLDRIYFRYLYKKRTTLKH